MRCLHGKILAGFLSAAASVATAAEMNFATVRELAQQRAAQPYRAPDEMLPGRLGELNYDDVRKIEFRRDAGLWARDTLPFQVQFFPRAGLNRTEVVVHEFDRSGVRPVAFEPEHFLVHEIAGLPALPERLGYAGFRVLFPLNRAGVFDEVAAFLGASYFRCLGVGQSYGLSARGLAVDCGVEGRAEEFPRFSEFWLGRPQPGAKTLTLYALLEGPTVAGGFEFRITPGEITRVDTRTALFFRDTGKLPGFAPLTSMFWYGENSPRPSGEKRPEVHDSDGLFVRGKDGAETWVPLQNPRAVQVTELRLPAPAIFGLAQRDRRPEAYADGEAHYERRPSAWIEPQSGWSAGTLRLLELPTKNEYADNIVACWVPESRPASGVPVELTYRLNWGLAEPPPKRPARVIATRTQPVNGATTHFEIDFAGGSTREKNQKAFTAAVTASNEVRVSNVSVRSAPETRGWRAAFDLEARDGSPGPIDLQCELRRGREVVSETWRFRWAR